MKIQVQIKQSDFESIVARRNLDWEELAKKLGIHRAYLSNVKNASLPQFRPSPEVRKKMLKVLKVGFDEIFEVLKSNNKKPKAKKKKKKAGKR